MSYAVFKGKKRITCWMSRRECEEYLMGEAFPERLKIHKQTLENDTQSGD
jgi:hypothetical protein